MAKAAIFAEQFAVVGGDGDVGIFRRQIEQLPDHTVQISHSFDLTFAQGRQFRGAESGAGLWWQFSPDDKFVKMLEDAMDAADFGPCSGRFVGTGIGLMRLADIEQPERGLPL